MIGVRSGREHRFTGVWVVAVGERVFVRSWNDEAGGWRCAFLREPRGAVRLGTRQLPVRARTVRSEALLKAVDEAYRKKYSRPADGKWVRGLCGSSRRATTTQLVPS